MLSGLEVLQQSGFRQLRGLRVGLLCHGASVDSRLTPAWNLFRGQRGFKLVKLFGPQHGIGGHTQANMVPWRSYVDPKLGLPVYSLYGKVLKPTGRMLSGLDALVVDLQDVGCKVYTYIWTLRLCLDAAKEAELKVIVLDRPNPIGGRQIEGELGQPQYRSFVGLEPIPPRHGMTIGELALLFNASTGADLSIVPLSGWTRDMYFDETGLPWVLPSPNIPTPSTALVYPATVLLEGTNCSEGRGTTKPFEMIGAPWIDGEELKRHLERQRLPGVIFRACSFVPTFDKYAGKLCHGLELHVVDRRRFRPCLTGAALLWALWRLYPKRAKWRKGPYEYERRKLPIDIIWGSPRLREQVEERKPLRRIEAGWKSDQRAFEQSRRPFLLY